MPIFESREATYTDLVNKGYDVGALEDKLFLFLSDLGYTSGSLEDRFYSYLKEQTSSGGSINDLIRKQYIDGGYTSLGDALANEAFLITLLFALNVDASITQAGAGAVVETRQSGGSLALTQLAVNESAYPGMFRATTVADGAKLGSEELTNGNFLDETSTDSSVAPLAGWVNAGTHNATNKVTLAGGVATFISDGVFTGIGKEDLTDGALYRYEIIIDSITSGVLKLTGGSVSIVEDLTAPGIYTGYFTSDGVFRIARQSACEAEISSASIHKILPTSLDVLPGNTPCHPSETVQDKTVYLSYNPWAASETVAVGDKRTFNSVGNWMEVQSITTGITGGSEPTLPAAGNTVVDGGVTWVRAAANYYASGHGGPLCEPAGTNKCENYNAAPVVNSKTVKGGDAASVFSVVGDEYELDNTGGASFAYVQILGACGTTNPCSLSADAYTVTGTGRLQWFDSNTGAVSFTNTTSERIKAENLTPGATSWTMALRAEAGSKIRWKYNQLEEGAVATSRIKTETAAITRTASNITVPVSGTLPASGNDFYLYFQGVLTWDGTENCLFRAAGAVDLINVRINTSGNFSVGDKAGGVFTEVSTSDPFTENTPRFFRGLVSKSRIDGVKVIIDGGTIASNSALTTAYDGLTGSASIGSKNGVSDYSNSKVFISIIQGQITDADKTALTNGTKTIAEVL